MNRNSQTDRVSSLTGGGVSETAGRSALRDGDRERDADLARREARLQAMAEEQARREAMRKMAGMKGPGMSRAARGVLVLSVGGLAVILGLVFLLVRRQALEQDRAAREAAARQQAMEEEFSMIRAGQEELRKLNRERDALLAQLTQGMAADKEAVRKKLAVIEAKRKALAEKLARKPHHGHSHGQRRKPGQAKKGKSDKGAGSMGPIDRRYDVLPD